ncbi:MAG: AfsR/SARP family transcriptional regulator [Acidimicrobiales bacterium]
MSTPRRSAGRTAKHPEAEDPRRLALGLSATVAGLAAPALVWRLGPGSLSALTAERGAANPPFERHALEELSPQAWGFERFELNSTDLAAAEREFGRSVSHAAALITLWSSDGCRTLLDIMAMGSVAFDGPPVALGYALADIVGELASNRWCVLDEVVLVGADPAAVTGPATELPNVTLASTVSEAQALLVHDLECGVARRRCFVALPERPGTGERRALPGLLRLAAQSPTTCVVCCDASAPALGMLQLVARGHAGYLEARRNGRTVALLYPDDAVPPSAVSNAPATPRPHRAVTAGPPAERLTHFLPPAGGVDVKVLGPVTIGGDGICVQRAPRMVELIAYLALHPEGVSRSRLEMALWPRRRVADQSVTNRLHEARRALGIAADGKPRLRRRVDRHVLSDDVACDWHRFQVLTERGTGPDSWQQAMELIRGEPLSELPGGDWTSLEGCVARIVTAVVEVATDLAEHHMQTGNLTRAEWALRKGLLAARFDERLHRMLMMKEDAAGNPAGVEAALLALARILDLEGDPLDGVHPITAALYRRLTRKSSAPPLLRRDAGCR